MGIKQNQIREASSLPKAAQLARVMFSFDCQLDTLENHLGRGVSISKGTVSVSSSQLVVCEPCESQMSLSQGQRRASESRCLHYYSEQ